MPTAANSRPPLGLPSGSVRALLTLMIVAVVIAQLARGSDVELLWTETLMIALAHYFTARRFIRLPPDVIARLAQDGYVDTETRPLYLPRHSIRAITVLAFAGLAIYLYRVGRLLDTKPLSVLGVVFAYLLGVVVRIKRVRRWEDVKAAVVLLILLCTASAYLAGRNDLVPPLVRNITLGVVLFYFGSR
jgi:fucose 4-O-acetylase-like acetyltransferase